MPHARNHSNLQIGVAIASYPTSIANWKARTEAAVAPTARSACANRTVRISFVMCVLR
jgi:hypothetical protein